MKGSFTTASAMPTCCSTMRGIRLALAFTSLSIFLSAGSSLREQGIASYNAGRYSAALSELKTALVSDPHNQSARVFLALTQAALGDCPSALPVLTPASNEAGSDLSKLAGLSAVKCDTAAGDSASALSLLEKLERRFPNDADVLYLTAKLHMKAFNDATFAMFQRTPGSYRVHELSAEIFEVENRYSDAVAEYRKAVEISPSAPDLHYRLGRALLLENHSPESLNAAADAFRSELAISPEDSACEYQLGQIAEAQGRSEEARSHYERALKLSSNFVQALVALGKLDIQDKSWTAAISHLSKAANLQPSNEAAHYALLTAYRDAGDLEKAKAEKEKLDQLQKLPSGEFTDFLNKLDEKTPKQ